MGSLSVFRIFCSLEFNNNVDFDDFSDFDAPHMGWFLCIGGFTVLWQSDRPLVKETFGMIKDKERRALAHRLGACWYSQTGRGD